MPNRLVHRFHTELMDLICDMIVREGVPLAHVREITQDSDMSYIWHTLPCDMKSLMCYIIKCCKLGRPC